MDVWNLWLLITCVLLFVVWLIAEALAARTSRKWVKRLRGLERGRRAMAGER